jgi:hypothetical protein
MQTKLIDIGIDWMTITTKEEYRWEEWKSAFQAVASQERARGHKWIDAKLLGYTGEQCGHAFIGKRQDGAMVRLSSAVAEESAWLFSPDACHCTRIDIQTTVELSEPRPTFLEEMYEYARKQPVENGHPPSYTLLKNSSGGGTLYVGSRSSMRYGRTYDKGIEEGGHVAGKQFRYELEIKDTLADQAVAMLAGCADVERQYLAMLGDFFSKRHIRPLWHVPASEGKLEIPRIASDDAGSLRWLGGPVGATVARLIHSVGHELVIRAIFAKSLTNLTDDDTMQRLIDVWGD